MPGSAPKLRLTSSKVPPSSVRTLTGMSFAAGATLAMPVPLSVTAAAIPATCVPFGEAASVAGPLSQSPSPQPFGASGQPVNVAPPTGLRLRSGWARSTPLSTTAMTWPLPVDVAHACSA